MKQEIKKLPYETPTMRVFLLNTSTRLLQASQLPFAPDDDPTPNPYQW